MEISLGIYAIICLLFYIVIPGYIFRRFYFNGEFSKQLSLSSNTNASTLFSSILIGVSLQLFAVIIYNLFSSSPIDIESKLTTFDANFISGNKVSDVSSKFSGLSNDLYKYYLPYLGTIYISAGVLGYFISKLIYIAKIDAKFKLFRFKNEWHYLLSGRILSFRKIKSNQEQEQTENLKVLYVIVDVLVREIDGETKLYSGLVADYELNHFDIGKLERLHLLRAQRWSKDENGLRVRKNIPGNLFTIMGEQIININSTFICEKQEEKEQRRFQAKRVVLLSAQVFSAILFIFILSSFIFKLNFLQSDWYFHILSKPLWEKLLIAYMVNLTLGLFTPFYIDKKEENEKKSKRDKIEFFGWKAYFLKVVLLVVVGAILVYVNREYFCPKIIVPAAIHP